MKCVDCKYIGNCKEKAKEPDLSGCTSGIPIEKMGIKTNGDRIKKMTNEELADFLSSITHYCGIEIESESDLKRCPFNEPFFCSRCNGKGIMQWLESEVENG